MNPWVFVGVLKEIGDEHIQGSVFGQVVRNGQKAAPNGKGDILAEWINYCSVGNIHGRFTTPQNEDAFVIKYRCFFVLRGMDEFPLELAMERRGRFKLWRYVGRIVKARAHGSHVKVLLGKRLVVAILDNITTCVNVGIVENVTTSIASRCIFYQGDSAAEFDVFHQIEFLCICFQIFDILLDGGVVGTDRWILVEAKIGERGDVLGRHQSGVIIHLVDERPTNGGGRFQNCDVIGW